MMDILRDQAWQGIGALVAVLLGFLGLYYASRQKKWLYLSGAVICIIAGVGIGVKLEQVRISSAASQQASKVQKITPIQTIDFDYQDSLMKHDWTLVDGDEKQLVVSHISDNLVGSAVAISSTSKYGLDFQLGLPAIQLGKVIEFTADLRDNASVYALVGLKRDDGSTTTGWLKFSPRVAKPSGVVLGTGTGGDEWVVPIKPILSRGRNWLLYQIDLEDAVNSTFGNDRWRFQQLNKLRIRGDLSLDYITVFEKQQ